MAACSVAAAPSRAPSSVNANPTSCCAAAQSKGSGPRCFSAAASCNTATASRRCSVPASRPPKMSRVAPKLCSVECSVAWGARGSPFLKRGAKGRDSLLEPGRSNLAFAKVSQYLSRDYPWFGPSRAERGRGSAR